MRVHDKRINNSEKYTAIELELGPKKTVNIPPRIAKLIKYPAMKTVTLIIRSP